MRTFNCLGTVSLLVAAACAGQEGTTTTNDLGLKISQLDDSHIAGTMTTMAGSVDFAVTQDKEQPGQFEIRFDRGQGQFGTSVDLTAQTADFAWPEGMLLTDDDRFVLTALAAAIENDLGKETGVTDNLFRNASLWGAHPVGAIILKPIVGDPERGWTKLCSYGACSSGSRSFSHSGGSTERSAPCGSHAGTTKSHTRTFGRNDTINPCMARCGAGCYSVGTSAWTQDCGNHDICEYWHTSDCGGELSSASDDYVLAANCGC
jgi:hypothetical protein